MGSTQSMLRDLIIEEGVGTYSDPVLIILPKMMMCFRTLLRPCHLVHEYTLGCPRSATPESVF